MSAEKSNGNLLSPTDGVKVRIVREETPGIHGKRGDVLTMSPNKAQHLIFTGAVEVVE